MRNRADRVGWPLERVFVNRGRQQGIVLLQPDGGPVREAIMRCVDQRRLRDHRANRLLTALLKRGRAMPKDKEAREEREKQKLDRELEETFPASDPPKVTRSIPTTQITSTPRQDEEPGSN